MKVDSKHKYRLPGGVVLPQGVSEIGELPAKAKKFLDGLIGTGIVTVLGGEAKVEAPKPTATTHGPTGAPPVVTTPVTPDATIERLPNDGRRPKKD